MPVRALCKTLSSRRRSRAIFSAIASGLQKNVENLPDPRSLAQVHGLHHGLRLVLEYQRRIAVAKLVRVAANQYHDPGQNSHHHKEWHCARVGDRRMLQARQAPGEEYEGHQIDW